MAKDGFAQIQEILQSQAEELSRVWISLEAGPESVPDEAPAPRINPLAVIRITLLAVHNYCAALDVYRQTGDAAWLEIADRCERAIGRLVQVFNPV